MMRPTVNISKWKLAVDLTTTRVIQNHLTISTVNCECKFCQNWLLAYKKVLPIDLLQQLQRLGVSPIHPVDAYGGDPKNGKLDYRIWYYVVGKILSGPNGWVQDENLGEIRNYVTIREHPYYLSLMIQPQKNFDDKKPDFLMEISGDLIQIDFRLCVPWLLS